MLAEQKAGIYVLDHPYEPNMIKIGCAKNIQDRLRNGCYVTMFPPDKVPQLLYQHITPEYEGHISHQQLEAEIHAYFDKYRIYKAPNRRELFDKEIFDRVELFCLHHPHFDDLDLPQEPGNPYYEYDFQNEIVDKCFTYYCDGNLKGKLVMACGTGKSYVARDLVKRVVLSGVGRIIVLVPSLLLAEQFGKNFKEMNVMIYDCQHDKNAVKNGLNLQEQFAVEDEELRSYIVISTYQSALELVDYVFDMVIYDEAHRTCVDGEVFSKTVSHWDGSYKLFMTATQKVYEDDVEYSMDNEQTYGALIHELNFEDSIERGYITPFITCFPTFDSPDDYEDDDLEDESAPENSSDDSENNSEDSEDESASENSSENSFESGDICSSKSNYDADVYDPNNIYADREYYTTVGAILGVLEDYPIYHLLVYFNTCERAKYIRDELEKYGDDKYDFLYMDGECSKHKRKQIINQFSIEDGRKKILCSVNVLGEGISINCCDSVFFADKRCSEINITQNIGRCLRRYRGVDCDGNEIEKKFSYVFMCPDMIDTGMQNIYNISKKFFRWQTNGGRNKKNVENKISICGKKIKYKQVGGVNGMWDYMYDLCMRYEQETGKLIKNKDEYCGAKIGNWIVGNVRCYRKKRLSMFRENKLRALLTFEFRISNYNPRENLSFEENIRLCKEFEEGGNYIKTSTIFKDAKIGSFLSERKKDYKKGKLSEEKLSQLQTLNSWNNAIEKGLKTFKITPFEENIRLCREFEEGGNYIQARTIFKNAKIGLFLSTKKKDYKSGKLSEEKLLQLQTLNSWNNAIEKGLKTVEIIPFEENIRLCREFEKGGNYIKTSTIFKDAKIGRFLDHKKKDYKDGKLSEEKLSQLQTLNSWNCALEKGLKIVIKIPFEEKIRLCREFEEGGNHIKQGTIFRACKIGSFLSENRRHLKNGKLSEEKLLQLQTLNSWNFAIEKGLKTVEKLPFEENIRLCKEFEEGGNHVNDRTVFKLRKIGIFLANKKKDHKEGKLSEEKLLQLQTLNSWNEWASKNTK